MATTGSFTTTMIVGNVWIFGRGQLSNNYFPFGFDFIAPFSGFLVNRACTRIRYIAFVL